MGQAQSDLANILHDWYYWTSWPTDCRQGVMLHVLESLIEDPPALHRSQLHIGDERADIARLTRERSVSASLLHASQPVDLFTHPTYGQHPRFPHRPLAIGWVLKRHAVTMHWCSARDVNTWVRGTPMHCVDDRVTDPLMRRYINARRSHPGVPLWRPETEAERADASMCVDDPHSDLALKKQRLYARIEDMHQQMNGNIIPKPELCRGLHNELEVDYGPCDIMAVFYVNNSRLVADRRWAASRPGIWVNALSQPLPVPSLNASLRAAAAAAKRALLAWSIVAEQQRQLGCLHGSHGTEADRWKASPVEPAVVQYSPAVICDVRAMRARQALLLQNRSHDGKIARMQQEPIHRIFFPPPSYGDTTSSELGTAASARPAMGGVPSRQSWQRGPVHAPRLNFQERTHHDRLP